MLPKASRLNLRTDFSKIVNGKKAETSSLKFFWLLEVDSPTLVGVSISKKFFKKAIERNKIKRLVWRAATLIYPELKKGLHLIIMPKGIAKEKNLEEILAEIRSIKDLFQED